MIFSHPLTGEDHLCQIANGTKGIIPHNAHKNWFLFALDIQFGNVSVHQSIWEPQNTRIL